MQSIIFGYVATYDLDKIPYALLDLSRSRESAELIAKIDGSTAFERVKTLSNANEIAESIDSGEVILEYDDGVACVDNRYFSGKFSAFNLQILV